MKKFPRLLWTVLLLGCTHPPAAVSTVPLHAFFEWRLDAVKGITRDGTPYTLVGQSCAADSPLFQTPQKAQAVLDQIHSLGVNCLSLHQAGWAPYDRIISALEEWNSLHPDNGDPNQALHYFIQIDPTDRLGNYPDLSLAESIHQALLDETNPHSLPSQIKAILAGRPRCLLGFMIGKGLNKQLSQVTAKGSPAQAEAFLNSAAVLIRSRWAAGFLLGHNGDAAEQADVYQALENADQLPGNVLAEFDVLAWNLELSTRQLRDGEPGILKARAALSGSRGWFLGAAGVSTVKTATATDSYNQVQAAINSELLWCTCRTMPGNSGVIFAALRDAAEEYSPLVVNEQRGWFDFFGEPKFIRFLLPVIFSSPNRFSRRWEDSKCAASASADRIFNNDIRVIIRISNKTADSLYFLPEYLANTGKTTGSPQGYATFSQFELSLLKGHQYIEIERVLSGYQYDGDYVIAVRVYSDINPPQRYLWGREAILVGGVLIWTK